MMEVKCAFDEMVPIGNIHPNKENPNRHPGEQIELLARVMERHGWRLPITVSTRSGCIVRGHGRYLAALQLGLHECPVDFQDYETDEEEKADLIADNKLAELAEIDKGMLKKMLQDIQDSGYDPIFTGYDVQELNDLLCEQIDKSEMQGPEVEFVRELLQEHNYIVLYFDNIHDWEEAKDKFELAAVRDLVARNKMTMGVGRVVPGKKWLDRIK